MIERVELIEELEAVIEQHSTEEAGRNGTRWSFDDEAALRRALTVLRRSQ